jgi:hypothetical protein
LPRKVGARPSPTRGWKAHGYNTSGKRGKGEREKERRKRFKAAMGPTTYMRGQPNLNLEAIPIRQPGRHEPHAAHPRAGVGRPM